MSWSNPSQEEAQEAYDTARSKYNSAAQDYCSCTNKINNCRAELNSVKNQYQDAKSEKLNFDKRKDMIRLILIKLSDSGSVQDTIDDANNAVKAADDSFRSCVYCSDIAPGDFTNAFRVPAISQDSASATAVDEFKRELARIEQAEQEIDKKLDNMMDNIKSLTQQSNNLTAQQSSYKKIMNSMSYEMSHYKKYT